MLPVLFYKLSYVSFDSHFCKKYVQLLTLNICFFEFAMCSLEICRQRNIQRGDRYETQSDEQFELMAKNIKYSVNVDTSLHSAAECAEKIIYTSIISRGFSLRISRSRL